MGGWIEMDEQEKEMMESIKKRSKVIESWEFHEPNRLVLTMEGEGESIYEVYCKIGEIANVTPDPYEE
ncbi:unnamed protein product [marine sediment metagenome]|uniref:Uncharacterized protein n=1 Tax=marine sediment metagenome TaxID=412755 RepID=X0XA22_9ZZZZ